jgi:phosphoribosylamine-glycine ligase
MKCIAGGRLVLADFVVREEASLVLYLVSPDYALRPGPAYDFTLDRARIESEGCNVFFSSAIQTGENAYRTVGTSRAVALTATAPTLEQARLRVVRSAATVSVLEWRRDVGEARYLEGLSDLLGGEDAPGEQSQLSNAG